MVNLDLEFLGIPSLKNLLWIPKNSKKFREFLRIIGNFLEYVRKIITETFTAAVKHSSKPEMYPCEITLGIPRNSWEFYL